MGRGGGAVEGDRQLLLAEMERLREQYEDHIKQMEQTQAIIDKQQVIHRGSCTAHGIFPVCH